MGDDFRSRNEDHEYAMACVRRALAKHGIEAEPYGTETDRREARELLVDCWNDVAILQRYRPDLAIRIAGYGSAHCEVKTAKGGYADYVIEAKAAWAAAEHGRDDPWAMYAFFHMPEGPIIACRTCELRLPPRINMPRRWDNAENRAWLADHFPGCWFKPEGWEHGAGTPYFRVSRSDPSLMRLDPFIRERILRPIPAAVAPAIQQSLSLDFQNPK
jgi:hypothetical protein